MGRVLAVSLVVLAVAAPGTSQEPEFGGEIRPRFEIRDPVPGLGTLEFTSMRTRLHASTELSGAVRIFVQLQDVRVFGEEGSTLEYSADGLDLHQGWVELGDDASGRWSVRVGRQEAVYGGQRLIGAVNWTQQGRVFDGARIRFRPSDGVVVDGLAYRVGTSVAPGPAAPGDRSLYGVYTTLEVGGSVDVVALLDTRPLRDLYTVGGRWVSGPGALTGRVEASYQTGTSDLLPARRDIAAFMVGGRVGTELENGVGLTLWYDYLSGDNDPTDGTDRVFDTLYATNHKFYGFMDLFLNIPVHTNRRGLQDLALKGRYALGAGREVSADLHAFRVAASDNLANARIGEELDVTYRWSYGPGVTVTSGLSYFMAGDAWSAALGNADENQVWGYVMLDVVF